MGLYVPEEYGGQGLSPDRLLPRVRGRSPRSTPTLSVVMGVHQSIGMKGIVLFGTDEQKERFLPDLAARPQARRLRAHRARGRLGRARACRRAPSAQSDGSWRLNGDEALHRQRREGRRCS